MAVSKMSKDNLKNTITYLKPLTLLPGFISSSLVNIVLKGLREQVTLDNDLTEKKILLDTPDGGQVVVRILSAKNTSALSPCLIYFQGGGFVLVEAPHQRRLMMAYAKRTGATIVDVLLPSSSQAPLPNSR